MKISIKTLEGDKVFFDLHQVGECYPSDDVIYIDDTPCVLSTATPGIAVVLEHVLRYSDARLTVSIEITLGNTYWVRLSGDGLEVEADESEIAHALTLAYAKMIAKRQERSGANRERRARNDIGDVCGNCRGEWPCGCGDPVQVCGICMCSVNYGCRCDERSGYDWPFGSESNAMAEHEQRFGS